ncbi:MAG: MarR family winged helix-turn-helix transcriptional regulator [Cellulomonas sp.]
MDTESTPSTTPIPAAGADSADDPMRSLESELGLLLRRSHAMSRQLAHRVHPDVEPSASPLLARIAKTPDVRASELAALFGVGRSTMSRQLSRLDELGLIERRPDPDDSRGQLIRLTELGIRRSHDVRAAGRAFLRRALRSWSDEDAALLAAQLARLNRDLGVPPDRD